MSLQRDNVPINKIAKRKCPPYKTVLVDLIYLSGG